MAITAPESIRNLGIMAHIDAGKTTLSERMLFYCQKIHKLGEVHDGAATMDYLPEEQERGITITSACTTCQWTDKNINLIDTPGHVDFTMEVERCLRVLDGAICVFCAVAGVEPQSETVWRQSELFSVPKLAFINKMDREGANFEAVLQSMRERLLANPMPLNIPLGQGSQFSGVLDLLHEEKIIFLPESEGRTIVRAPFTESERAQAAPWREKLLETLAEADDIFMELWLDGKFTDKDIDPAIKRATLERKITPVFCGSALRNIGVQPLLDAVCAYLPSPLDVPEAIGQNAKGKQELVAANPKGPAIALVFKVVMDGTRKNSFVRLYSGTIQEGISLENCRTSRSDRIGRLLRLHADRREQIDALGAGDIACIVGLRDAQTGDTYATNNDPIILEPIQAYEPVITLALEPLNADEGKILDEALNRYAEEDPTLKFGIDEETGLRTISGMGELHLDVVLERLAREYKIRPRAGEPQVIQRETALKTASAKVNFDRELGKERHQGEVAVTVTPRERGSGNTVSDFLPENDQEARKILPPLMREAVLSAIKDSLETGVASGWPITDVAVHIDEINKTEGVTTIPGLRMAASQALREAMQKARSITLEPVMDVEITVPDTFLGSVINLFNQTGGKIEELGEHAGLKILRGIAPLRKLFGFATRVRSASQGRAGFAISFKTFDQV